MSYSVTHSTTLVPHGVSCAHCKLKHRTVQEVFECAQNALAASSVRGAGNRDFYSPPKPPPVAPRPAPARPVSPVSPVTPPRPASPASPVRDYDRSFDESQVPEGRYAVEIDGVLKFVRVGKTWGHANKFRNVYVYRSDDQIEVRNVRSKQGLLKAILAVNPMIAGLRFGLESSRCCRCGKRLTDETSRALGMGADCRKVSSWFGGSEA